MRNAVLSLVILVATLQTTESLKTCQTKDGVKSVPCNHGDCSSDGSCLCQPCWKGAFCDIFVNKYEPTFDRLEHNIVTNVDVHSGERILRVNASDQDFSTTCSRQLPCDCANISYSILSGNQESKFMIDPDTGIISLANGARRSDDARYFLEIVARNPNKDYGDVSKETYSVTSVHILLPGKKEHDNEYHGDHHLSRHKRYAPANPIPTNTTFELEQVGAPVTYVEKGMALTFELYLHFALGTTDLLVEIFTPVNQTEIFTLCKPTITHVGSNIQYDERPPLIDRSETTGVDNRAVFELGNVTNSGTATSNYEDSIIKIVFTVIMIDPATDPSVNGKSFWLSAGVEYNNKDDIWIGQKSFIAMQVTNFTATPASFNLSGPSEVSVDAAALFNLELNLPILANEVKIDVFSPLDLPSVMTVCNIRVTGHGSNFECLDTSNISSSLTASEIDSGYSRGHLDMGYVTNSMLRSNTYDSSEDYFNVQFTISTFNDTSLIGKTVYVGAAVMMGPDYIWTTRKPILIKDVQPFTDAQTVQSSIDGGKLTVRANEPAITFIHLYIPNEGVCNIAIKLSLPPASLSSFDICKLSVVSSGINIPCMKEKQKFYLNAEGEAFLNLGTVTAFKAGNETDNGIIIQLVVKPRDSITKGTYVVNAEVTSESTTTVVTPLTYNVNVFNDSITANDTYKPVGAISVQNDKQTILQGESTRVSVNITFPEAATIPVIEIESFAVGANGMHLFTLCKAEIAWVGRNIQCLNLTRTKELMQFTVKPESDDFDYKVKVPFEDICLTDLFTEPYDNTITIDLTYRLDAAIPGNKTWITAGLTLNKKLWVGQVAIQEKTGIADVMPNGPQRVDFSEVKTMTTLPISYIQGYNISIKIPPLSAAKVVVKVSSDSPDLSICSVRLVAKGSNIGCVKNITTEVLETNSLLRKSIEVDFGPITNLGPHGIHQSINFDKSTVILQALVSFKTASTGNLNIDVTLGTRPPITKTYALTSTANATGANYTNVVQNVLSFVAPIANRTSTDVNKGEAKRVVIQFYVSPETFQGMKFQTRVDKIGMVEICDYNIIHSGVNIPCLDRTLIKGQNISKEEWKIEANICSWPVNEEDPESNKVQVEAIVKVPKDSAIPLNDVISVITDIYINDSLVETSQVQLTVVDAFTEDFMDWMTNDNTTNFISLSGTPVTSAAIGEVFDLNINLSIPVNSTSLVKFNVSVPVSETARMTIQDIKYNGSDEDIACQDFAEANYASTKSTSQMDMGEMDFGIVTNTGVSRRILQQEELYFSTIHVILTLQMADAKDNIDQAEQNITMELRVGSFTGTLYHIVKVNRNANNAPKIYFEAGFNDTGRPLFNHFLTVHALMRLENDSTAELRPALAIFYLSPWVQYADRFTTNKIGAPPNATFDNKTGRLEFKFQEFPFTDNVKFSFAVSRKPFSYTKPLVNSTTPYEAGGYITHHPGSSFAPDYFFSSPMNAFMFTVQIPTDTQSTCAQLLNINECQITVPFESKYQSGVFRAFIRSNMYAAERYLQVYFGNTVKVEKISILMEHYTTGPVKVFKMAYSDDGMSWVSGPMVTVDHLLNVSIPRPQESRYLRFFVVEHHGNEDNLVALKLELFGCQISTDVADVCANAPTVQDPTGWYHRGFLEVDSKVFVCDANPKKDLRMFCYYSEDGVSWYPLDTRLGNVNVYDKEKKVLYGISNDKVSYMSSNDGFFWKSVEPATVIDLINGCDLSKCTKVKTVPWQNGTTLGRDTVSRDFEMVNWGASYNGLFKKLSNGTWEYKADWSKCGP
ncbi:uncharacterized protein LOC115217410 [Octopus sinensis]|uniref:Uncharacterized protein LOC115217410 n=1 Tax=Octopus sinensis TaxID=2607531 RepID=A0A6P7SXB1_9MOLL|nr:uncharacterized protein LOC115217410 [Octopus sinensis]